MEYKKIVSKYLRDTADRIDTGLCEITESEAMLLLGSIAHEPLSKELACVFMNMSRSSFDTKVRNGELPLGRKRVGFKELVWYKDELL